MGAGTPGKRGGDRGGDRAGERAGGRVERQAERDRDRGRDREHREALSARAEVEEVELVFDERPLGLRLGNCEVHSTALHAIAHACLTTTCTTVHATVNTPP